MGWERGKINGPLLGDSRTVKYLLHAAIKEKEEGERGEAEGEGGEEARGVLRCLPCRWRSGPRHSNAGSWSSRMRLTPRPHPKRRKRKKRRKRRTPRTSSLPSRARRRQRQWSCLLCWFYWLRYTSRYVPFCRRQVQDALHHGRYAPGGQLRSICW